MFLKNEDNLNEYSDKQKVESSLPADLNRRKC